MKLSVITLICDGYEHLIDKWVKNAREAILIDKEIIIVDNTTAQSVPKIDGVKVVKAGHNAMQFAGRRMGVEASTGDYIFLVDADDDILPITHFEWDEEMICFNYMAKFADDNQEYICGEPYRIAYTASKTATFFDTCWKDACKNMVWNKFYKRDLLMRVCSHLPYIEICFMEDVLLNLLVLAEVTSIRFENKSFYRYYFGTGISTKKKYTDLAPLVRIFSGIETALTVFNLAFDEKAQEQSGITTVGFYKGCMLYALQKIETVDDCILPMYMQLIKSMFKKELLLKSLEKNSKTFSRKAYLRAKHAINDNF